MYLLVFGLIADNGVSVAVNAGDFSGNGYGGLSVLNASTVINNGTFTGNGGEGVGIIDASTVTVNGGSYTGNIGSGLLLNGGNLSAAALDITGNQYGVNVQSGVADISGGTFNNVGYDIVGSGSITTLYGQWIGGPTIISSSTTGAVPLTGSFMGTLANGGGQQHFSYELYRGGKIVLANSAQTVPEPSALVLLALALVPVCGFAICKRRTCAEL